MLPKSSFQPSRTESRIITELVHKLKMGYIKEEEEKKEEPVFDLWSNETDPDQFRSRSHKIPPPSVHLPCLVYFLFCYVFISIFILRCICHTLLYSAQRVLQSSF